MLVLSRRQRESIVINDDIVITVTRIRGGQVHLGFQAPAHTPIHRLEVYDAIASSRVAEDRRSEMARKR
jgi:carbon storage regulator